MKQFILFMSLFTFVATGCSHSSKKTEKQRTTTLTQNYRTVAEELLKTADRGKSKTKTEKLGMELILIGEQLMNEIAKKRPQCAPYLKQVIGHKNKMVSIQLAEIEELYHVGKALPTGPDECHEAKELIVHPATVVLLAREKWDNEGRAQMADEIEEVLLHLENL